MAEPKVYVLRLNHRQSRDKRTTTHFLLTARAFGANKAIYTGQQDERMEKTIQNLSKTWGGTFRVEYKKNWKKAINFFKMQKTEIIHLTMYGLPIQDVVNQIIKSNKDVLVVVGGAKVPGEVFKLADWNVSITCQPHSEISALCIFLHEFLQGKEFYLTFEDAQIEVVPQFKGKKVISKNRN